MRCFLLKIDRSGRLAINQSRGNRSRRRQGKSDGFRLRFPTDFFKSRSIGLAGIGESW